ncbi:two-component regulator propeller domain-containing protein [Dysgonomonas sp. 511]|uniref:ligand-binding sensor domain-containing protein n=1 Tax=Dysgonomonas sp. 511 TaxID=2302930 RepID=UPI0013D6C0DF|nr:two-component regulator propeller domain-containing protein [Dysgonomonas sp. 511]NDV79157.1 helix-turn-helix domain-containing protein [Dysgonomonas sp. 511]
MKRAILIFHTLLFSLVLISSVNNTFVKLTTEQGLTSNTINCIYKDSRNFVWLGTANGLNRFDGFNTLSFGEFKDKSIVDIQEPDSVVLYIVSENELYRYNRKIRSNIYIPFGTDANIKLKASSLDKDKNLYIISNKGLFCYNSDMETPRQVTDNVLQNKVLTGICIDDGNICWLTTSDGLVKYDLNTKQMYNYKWQGENKFLSLARNGTTLYIGTQNNRILSFDTRNNSFSPAIPLDATYIQTISYHNNKLYIGTNGDGLKILNLKDKAISEIKHDSNNAQSLSANAVYSILVDDNSLWVGTFSGGLNYIPTQNTLFKTFYMPGGIDTRNINIRSFRICEDGCGIFGTRNGLIYNKDGNIRWYKTDNTPELKSNIVLNIYPYNENFFIGTFGGGLNIFDTKTKTVRNFKEETVFTENSFYSIIRDSEGFFWFGTLSGLIKYDERKDVYEIYNTSNSDLLSDDIYSVLEDSLGRIWIATREGVCYIENGKIKNLPFHELLSIGITRYIYEDSRQNIWLGCENQGLIRITKDLQSFAQYTNQDFLPDNYVSSIIEGTPGQIWITTTKGITLYDDNTSDYSIFSLYDGIPNYAFNDGAVQKTNNTIWWGNERGLIYLASLDTKEPFENKIYITKIVVDGYPEDVAIKKLEFAPEYLSSIKLPASQKNFIFRFSDFIYDYPSSVVYEYKLEGVQDRWQKALVGNDILITDVPGGSHVLKIRKAGNDGAVKTFLIIKDKSYILYWVIFLFIAIATVFFFTYKWFIKKLRKYKNSLKEREASNKAKYQNQKIEKDELETIQLQLMKYMEEEKPYLNPELKLDDIAKAINCSKSKISQVLNQHLDTNFSNFVSKYRIEMFKEKAAEGLLQQYTLSALARECGFSSRSSFFSTMKKLTGQTPSEFLKDSGINVND